MGDEPRQSEERVPKLTLLVTGDAPRSRRAQANLDKALRKLDRETVKPMVIDVLTHPEQSVSYSVFATPALLKTGEDGEISVFYGDLSDESKLLDLLDGIES